MLMCDIYDWDKIINICICDIDDSYNINIYGIKNIQLIGKLCLLDFNLMN